MRVLQIKISETDFQKYNFGDGEVKFTDLKAIISLEYAKQALLDCNEIAAQTELSTMTMDDINAEIQNHRDAKTHS